MVKLWALHGSFKLWIVLIKAKGVSKTMRILLVEDEKRIARFIKQGLEEEGYIVDIVSEGIAALDWVAQVAYDLILLDVMLPGLTGFEICRLLRDRQITLPILMLTARDDVDDRVKGLDSGADDYMSKPIAFKELLARVRALTRRMAVQAPAVKTTFTFADLSLNPVMHQVKRAEHEIDLTVKEYALLAYFMRHPRQPLSRTTILESVWGYQYEGASNVVDVYVRRLRRKLDATGDVSLIQTVRGMGYKLDQSI